MKKTMYQVVSGVLLAGVILLPWQLRGQSVYERSLIVPERPVYDAFEDDPEYNLRLGPVDIGFLVGVAGEYNDNITLAPDDSPDPLFQKESDIIIRPFAQVDAVWRLTELNELRFSLGLSYEKYLDNSEFDSESVLVSPTSAVALRFFVGDFRITVSDSFSYQEDPYSLPTISNQARYRRYENQVGVQVDYNATQEIILTAGYTHYNLWTVDEEFESLENSTDTVYFRPSVEVTPAVAVGLNTSASWSRFAAEDRGDSTNYLIGPFVDMQLSEYTTARVEVGWQQVEFDTPLSAGDEEGSETIYFRGEISNRLNESFTQRLAFSHFIETGFETNFYEVYRADYALDWNIFAGVNVRPSIFYEHFESSGEGGETGDRFGFSIGMGYQLTPSLTLGASYRFLIKDSNLPFSDYTQNIFTLSIAYEF